jgi:hypothetical protein
VNGLPCEAVPLQGRRILAALTRELHPGRRNWGEPPDLMFVYTGNGGRVHLRSVGIPWQVWASGECSDVLGMIAYAAEELAPLWAVIAPPGLIGVGVRCDAWALHGLPAEEVQALGKGQVRAHPAAARERFICAVDRGGTTYAIEVNSDGEVLATRVFPPGHPQSTATGMLPDALDRILRALLNVNLPARPDDCPDNPETERNGTA